MANDKGYLDVVKAHLQEHGESRGSDLAKAVGLPMGGLYSAIKGAISRGEIVKRNEGRAAFFALGDGSQAEAEDDLAEIRWAHWDDGDIVIYGLQENDDGSHTIPADVVEAMKRRLAANQL